MFAIRKAVVMGAAILAAALVTGAGSDEKRRASGTFEVKITRVSGDNGVASGRMSLAKTFAGDLTGSSKGDMWTAETAVQGSAGYVAIEKVEGTLNGRRGTFTLLHQGTMRRGGELQLRIVVVPESGTGELAGLAGTMAIRIEKGTHFYDIDYTISPPPR